MTPKAQYTVHMVNVSSSIPRLHAGQSSTEIYTEKNIHLPPLKTLA